MTYTLNVVHNMSFSKKYRFLSFLKCNQGSHNMLAFPLLSFEIEEINIYVSMAHVYLTMTIMMSRVFKTKGHFQGPMLHVDFYITYFEIFELHHFESLGNFKVLNNFFAFIKIEPRFSI